ncbi:beta-agarase [Pseudomonas sp. RIT-PI-AD]|uniref:beta-agarase n=1 Tax=Pseudomonas sp. RIT-PI-AD TaxID=3035294 RepID=UPI0021DADD94|nr:beta-agarase [Pseudomonas sp. RIT-PI-AD]
MLLGVAGPALAAEGQSLFNFVRPLDAVQVITENASLPSVTAETTAEGEILRRLTFNAGDQPSLRLTPQTGTWDWSQSGAMSLRIQNAMDWALTLDVKIVGADGKALHSRIALPAGPAQTLLVPLKATSPKDQGMRAGPPMPWNRDGKRVLLAESVEGELDAAQVKEVVIALDKPDVAQNILLGRFGTQGEDVRGEAYKGLVDTYGQFTRGDWPEKIKNDDQLKSAAQQERQRLDEQLAQRPEQDRFGGWLGGQRFEPSGFFRTEKRDGRWYLVTPEGNPFYSLGVNAINTEQSQTFVEGREAMFEGLPQEGEPLAAHYGRQDARNEIGANKGRAYAQGRWYDFYAANQARLNGTFDAAEWRKLATQRLQAWGFNTVGNWSDEGFSTSQQLPYTLPLSIHGDFATISTGLDWWGGMPDPFDPRFAMAAERSIAIAARDHRDDPWLIGFFADNELAWAGRPEDPHWRYALAYATLRLTTDVPAKRAFLKQLRDKYRNQSGLSAAWGIELSAWELMEDPGFEAPLPSPEHPAIEEDLKRFQRLYADTYFKTIADSLDWHAPNHMLLGGRFANSIPEAIEACAQYCDVLSFNFYTREPQHGYDFATLRALDKPLLVSEFHFGSRDRGPFWGGVAEVPREEDRGPAYAHFLEQALAEPQIVGIHWFQYLDQPVTGRLLDGENGHFGLVGITDRPWQGFVDAVRKANLQVPKAIRGNPVPASAAQPASGPANPPAADKAPAPAKGDTPAATEAPVEAPEAKESGQPATPTPAATDETPSEPAPAAPAPGEKKAP